MRTIKNLETNTEDYLLYNEAPVDGEAKFTRYTLNDKGNYVKSFSVNKNNEKEFNFSSLEEAKEYFLEKYGINADFKNLSQAILLKQAVETYTPLNYQGKGERLFEGLNVKSAKMGKDTFAIVQQHFSCVDKDDEEKIKEYEVDPNSENVVDFMGKYLIMEDQTLYFNENADIDNKRIRTEYHSGFHPVYHQKGYLVHELAHWLHYNNSARHAFMANEKDLTDDEKYIIRKNIGGYAARNFDEFIAEYIAARLDGVEFSKDIDDLYKSLGAPELF